MSTTTTHSYDLRHTVVDFYVLVLVSELSKYI
jgi:hypothetical protein